MAEVTLFRSRDCWKTWFFEECEESGLFGVNPKHLNLIRLSVDGDLPYHVGTEVYLEDAPVFPASSNSFHRVCGPYLVVSAAPLPSGAVVAHQYKGVPILYLEPHPERGPWGNGTKTRNGVCGLNLKYPQTAKRFSYYPYRFRIERSPRWEEIRVPHSPACELND